jgi:pyruvate,water dikinase
MTVDTTYVCWLKDVRASDVALVGGKNASLGEMLHALDAEGIRVPDGFATTAHAYRAFVAANGLEERVRSLIDAFHTGERTLAETGAAIRALILGGAFPAGIESEIRRFYRELSARTGVDAIDVAVRSSATAEDLPSASFAGQHESFLNIRGEEALLAACRECYASMFNDRAISYREARDFDHMEIALSVGVQRMVRSDLAAAGVMFTIDTESGYPDVTVINGAWGLGESVVKGTVTPDEFTVYAPFLDRPDLTPIISRELGAKEEKIIYSEGDEPTETVETSPEERATFVLSDAETVQLARWGKAIERHYGIEMDIEWARDGHTGELFIVQARPETVASKRLATSMKTYTLHGDGPVLAEGLAIGSAIATGPAQVILSVADIGSFRPGSILVTRQTDPDWVPIMRRAAGIVTDHGGRTSHAAIVSRELGVPAVIGTGNATTAIADGQEVTLSCVGGDHGQVLAGILEYEVGDVDLTDIETPRTRVMVNAANPATAFRWWQLPTHGIGLARMEFIITHSIRIHPMALAHPERVTDPAVRAEIDALTRGYDDKTEYFVDRLALGIARLAAPHYPEPVIVRMSDFKTNEYANLIGGADFEPGTEDNPMLGFRGASRYYSDRYRDGFALECRAIRRVREQIGFDNVAVMVPFCRTVEEADLVLAEMAGHGLARGREGLRMYVMAEIPSNVILASQFAERFDGFSIGSNDLTQLVLGVDRDAEALAPLFDERNEAVKRMIAMLIPAAHAAGTTVGICGEAPSNYPEYARFLVEAGIDSMSLSPDRVLETIPYVVEAEKALLVPAR